MQPKPTSIIVLCLMAVLFINCHQFTDIIVDIPPPTPTEIPPFVISRPVVEIHERPFYFDFAGIVFRFLNQSNVIVERITISFMLFDARTQDNPFIGSNRFQLTRFESILPNENREVIYSLDPFIHIAPTAPYIIDFFFISEIRYVDGSVWRDPHGKFRVRY